MPSIKSQFRNDINGLRAIAILGVLLFHYKVSALSGGFAGVDVFFVISGFLMSKIIINAIDNGKFSYWDYLGKRLKRIVPALLCLLIIVSSISFFIYLPEDFKLNSKRSASSALFLSNILFWKSTSYFAPASDTNILLHTWSLSVEWQFYLLYPFLLIVLKKAFSAKTLFKAVFTGLTALFFALSVYVTIKEPSASFYLLPTRAWEMMFGGIAFLYEDSVKSKTASKLYAVVGYLLIAVSFFFFKSSQAWPSFITIVPVLGTLLVIIANQNEMLITSNPVSQFIGKVSYSLYLWHWPIYVIAQYYGIKFSPVSVLLFTVIAVVLAYISYKYIESINLYNPKAVLAAMIVIFIGTAALSKINANTILYSPRAISIAHYQHGHKQERMAQYHEGTCHVSSLSNLDKSKCLCMVDTMTNILLLGDSHMGELSQSLRESIQAKGVNFLQATIAGTLPLLKDYQHKSPQKRKLMDYVFKDFIPKNASRIHAVILNGSWTLEQSNVQSNEELLKGIQETLLYLNKYHIKTVIIGQTERYNVPFPVLAARKFDDSTVDLKRYVDETAYDLDQFLLNKLGNSKYLQVINKKNLPNLSPDYIPYMTDNHHVSKYGADLIVAKLWKMDRFNEMFK